jgi:hypothetical protein
VKITLCRLNPKIAHHEPMSRSEPTSRAADACHEIAMSKDNRPLLDRRARSAPPTRLNEPVSRKEYDIIQDVRFNLKGVCQK